MGCMLDVPVDPRGRDEAEEAERVEYGQRRREHEADDEELAHELLSEGARRLASHTGPFASVNLLTQSRALRRAGEARGFLLA